MQGSIEIPEEISHVTHVFSGEYIVWEFFRQVSNVLSVVDRCKIM